MYYIYQQRLVQASSERGINMPLLYRGIGIKERLLLNSNVCYVKSHLSDFSRELYPHKITKKELR